MSRELDALDIQIAVQVMGLMHDAEGEIFSPRGTLYHWHMRNCPAADGIDEHHYSTDLNATSRAELRLIELGHHDAYVVALGEIMGATETGITHPVMLICAPAEARCRAMLSVLEGEK